MQLIQLINNLKKMKIKINPKIQKEQNYIDENI